MTLNVETAGDESVQPLLLMHGIISSRRTWQWLVPTLAERFRVLLLEFRGHGRSGRAPGDYQPQRYVDDAIAVLEHAASGPALLMGHSLGGMTAAALPQQRPELVTATVLVDPVLGSMEPDNEELRTNALIEAFGALRVSLPELQAAGLTAEQVAEAMASMPSTSGGVMGDILLPESMLAIAGGFLQADASVLDPVLEATAKNAFDRSRAIPVPTLLVTADPSKPDAVTWTASSIWPIS